QCVDLNDDNKVVAENTGQTSITVDLTGQDQDVVCTITNQSTKFGDLTVIKHLLPDTDAGRFDLHVGGTVTAVRPNATDGDTLTLTRIPFGPYDVTETAVPPTDLANYEVTTTCTNEERVGGTVAHNPTGPSVSFELNRTNNHVVCVIENRRATVPLAHLT